MPTCMIKSSSYTLNLPSAFFSVITFLFTQLKTCQANMKFEMEKPGKDGIEKTLEECVETFTMVLKNKDITKNTFLRNAGF